MIKTKDIFKIPVLIGNLTDIDNEILIRGAIDGYSDKFNVEPDHTFFEDSNMVESEELFRVFQLILDDFYKEMNVKIKVDGWWGHIHEPNMSSRMHAHIGHDWSVVYYPNVSEESGDIVFSWTIVVANDSTWSYTPKVGDYLIFPSWLNHYVNRNLTNKNRISISFNCTETKDGGNRVFPWSGGETPKPKPFKPDMRFCNKKKLGK